MPTLTFDFSQSQLGVFRGEWPISLPLPFDPIVYETEFVTVRVRDAPNNPNDDPNEFDDPFDEFLDIPIFSGNPVVHYGSGTGARIFLTGGIPPHPQPGPYANQSFDGAGWSAAVEQWYSDFLNVTATQAELIWPDRATGTITSSVPIKLRDFLDIPGLLRQQQWNIDIVGASPPGGGFDHWWDEIEFPEGYLADDTVVTVTASTGPDTYFTNGGIGIFDFTNFMFEPFNLSATKVDGTGPADVLLLPGSPNDYTVTVEFGDSWDTGHFPTLTIADGWKIVNGEAPIEFIRFADPFDNVVNLHGAGIAGEMLRLAAEVYGAQPTLGHRAQVLAYEGQPAAVTEQYEPNLALMAWGQRNWHPVEAFELGMPAALHPDDLALTGETLRYSFVGGNYAAYDLDPDDAFFVSGEFGDLPEANALVLTGIVEGLRTLAISFRGTDQFADFNNYDHFSEYYAKYAPLIQALKVYINNPANDIEQVLVSGHSLGVGALQYFMHEFSEDDRFKAFTVGSPGSDVPGAASPDNRIVNFLHTDDLVTTAPFWSSPAGLTLLDAAAGAISAFYPGDNSDAMEEKIESLIKGAEPKFHQGSKVHINSSIFYGVIDYKLTEHDKWLYFHDIIELERNAGEGASNPFAATDLAKALRDGVPYVGPDIQIALGTGHHPLAPGAPAPAVPFIDKIVTAAEDNYVLAGFGPDQVMIDLSWTANSLFAATQRNIDGGDGIDRLVITDKNRASFDWTYSPDGFDLKHEIPLVGGVVIQRQVGTLFRMEKLVLPDNDDADTIIFNFDGSPVNIQTRAENTTEFTVDPSFDAAHTGNGNVTTTGSAQSDIVTFGNGNQIINLGDGDDIVTGAPLVVSLPSDSVTLNGEFGNDYLRGAAGNDTLNGGDGDDYLEGGLGDDILNGGGGSDRFVSSLGSGSDTIEDFEIGVDLLDLTGRTSFTDLTQLPLVQVGNDTEIRFSDATITLKNVAPLALKQSDILFRDPAAVSDILVVGNGVEIADGDAAPSPADHTDFGSVAAGGAPVIRTFSVANTGTLALEIEELVLPAGFVLIEGLDSSIGAGDSDTFQVALATATAGTKIGQIAITTNDPGQSEFNFTISGTVTGAAVTGPEVSVTGDGVTIADGDTMPGAADGTAFGTHAVGATVERTFTVTNDGTEALKTSGLKLPKGFTLAKGEKLDATIAPGQSDTFTVLLDTKKVGTSTGVITFKTNDPDEADFDFAISGEVAAPEIDVSGNGVDIKDNSKKPGAADHTDFGGAAFGEPGTIRTFTINNSGGFPLSITNVAVPDGFTLIGGFPATVAANASATIQVQLDTTATGIRKGDIVILSDDANEATFNFTVQGTVTPQNRTGDATDNTFVAAANAEAFSGLDGIDTVSYADADGSVVASLLSANAKKNAGWAAGDTFDSIENLFGSAFSDTLTGNDGDNVLEGRAGADKLDGGKGIDTASYANAASAVTADLLKAKNNLGEHAAGDTYKNIENLLGSAFNDTLVGDTKVNVLMGGDGDDTLVGNGGIDTLTGGPGADTFVFNAIKDGGGATKVLGVNPPPTGDLITDFVSGEDFIGISRKGFKIAATLDEATFQAMDYFVAGDGSDPLTSTNQSGVAATTNLHGQFLFNEATDQLWWDPDGTGKQAAVLLATFTNGEHILATDFDLV